MRTVGFLAAIAACIVLANPIAAQTITPPPSLNEALTMDFLHEVRVGPTAGAMTLRYNPHRSGPVTGTLLGARVEGYYHTAPPNPDGRPARSLALLRYRGTTAVQAITADYDHVSRHWFGMAHWLKSGAGEGSTTQNALGFRTVSPTPRVCLRPPCTPDTTLPTVPTAAAPLVTDPLAGVNVVVGSEQGPLVFRTPTEGVFDGHLWGEVVSGHYASPAGTVVLLRSYNGQPSQIWRGVLAAGGQSGGRGFPLSAAGGAPFNWTAGAQDQIVTGFRSIYDRNSCAQVANAASGAGGFVDVFTCTDASRTAWVAFRVDTDQFGVASATTGLCLSLPETAGQRVRQQPCRNRASEVLQVYSGLIDLGGGFVLSQLVHNTAEISGASHFIVRGRANGTECMSLLVSQGQVITQGCLEHKSVWTTYR